MVPSIGQLTAWQLASSETAKEMSLSKRILTVLSHITTWSLSPCCIVQVKRRSQVWPSLRGLYKSKSMSTRRWGPWGPPRGECSHREPLDCCPIYSQATADRAIPAVKQRHLTSTSFLSPPALHVSFQLIKSFVCKLQLSNYANLVNS